jgi:hypothetical protein
MQVATMAGNTPGKSFMSVLSALVAGENRLLVPGAVPVLLAIKSGFTCGATDEFGYYAAENRMHIHDFHATAFQGMDHPKLTCRYSGGDFRLTDTAGAGHDGIAPPACGKAVGGTGVAVAEFRTCAAVLLVWSTCLCCTV